MVFWDGWLSVFLFFYYLGVVVERGLIWGLFYYVVEFWGVGLAGVFVCGNFKVPFRLGPFVVKLGGRSFYMSVFASLIFRINIQ